MPLSARVAPYDHVLVDLDGCLWIGEEAVPGAPQALQALREAGKAVAFLTNDPRHHPEAFVRKLWRLGFQASLDEVVTAGAAVQFLLAASGRPRTTYVVGSEALRRHVSDAGMRVTNGTDLARVSELVVVSAHEGFHYEELRIASQAVLRGAELVGTSRDATFPMPDGPWPGPGPVLAAVETAAQRLADAVAGKPEGWMYAAALDRVQPGRTLVVGDRVDTDVLGAQRAGLDSALVLSGATTARQAAASERPATHVADSFATLVLG